MSHFGCIFLVLGQPIIAKVPHKVVLGAILEEQTARDRYEIVEADNDVIIVIFKAVEQKHGCIGEAKQSNDLLVAAGGFKTPIIFKLGENEKEVEILPKILIDPDFFFFLVNGGVEILSVRVEFDLEGIDVAIVAYKFGKAEAEVTENLNKVDL